MRLALELLIIAAITIVPLPVQAVPCAYQIYTDPIKEPNYQCPSPMEDVLVPNLPQLPSIELKKDAPSPRDGILLDTNRVLELGYRIKALRRIRWMETIAAQKTLAAELRYQQKVSAAKDEYSKSQLLLYRTRQQESQQELDKERKWYRSWVFGFAVGVVTTTVATVGIALAVD